MEENPWKTLSSRSLFKNPWFSVREDQVIRPDGSPGIYTVVEPKIAVGVVALDEQDHVWLVGQFRYPINQYSWEIIEGGLDAGEAPIQTAARELKEEGGITAQSIVQLGPPVYLSNCFTNEQAQIFLARGITLGENKPDDTEVLQLRRISFAEALQLVRSGEISDALSVIALERTHNFLAMERR